MDKEPDMQDIRSATQTEGKAHRTMSQGQELFLWEKPNSTGGPARGTILFVHGSSMASQPTFDVQVEGMPEASAMNWFASRGFDSWCFDCRGYGRSYKGEDVAATISDGADDAKAASDYILRQGGGPLLVYGISSGALRAALFAERHPERVSRLALDAMVWTGEGSPTLEQRRKKLDQWRGSVRRPANQEFMWSIFNRDHPGTVHERIAQPFIDQVLALDDSMPNGTYIDMCANLPLVDPTKLHAATIVMRGEFDGIAGLDDLLEFFKRLPNADKEFAVMPGISHASFTQKNFLLAYQILYAFFTRPEPEYRA